MKHRKAFTLVELLVVMAIIALLIGLLLPALSQARARAMQLKDASQVKGIHQGWLIFASDHDGVMPLPGSLLREQILYDGQMRYVPGRGEPQHQYNTTDRLFATSIMHNLFDLEHCVGPTEPSPRVVVMTNFNYDAFSPINGWYWPGAFESATPGPGPHRFNARINQHSNVSYVHLVLGGSRLQREWRNTQNSQYAVLGNRGPEHGSIEPNVYEESLTLQIHGNRRQWEGNICYGDNHVTFHQNYIPEGINTIINNVTVPDNLFRNDQAGDAFTTEGRDIYLLQYPNLTTELDGGNFVIWTDPRGNWD